MKGVTKDVTPFGASGNWTINLSTLKSWTAKISCFVDTADTAQTNLFALLNTSLSITMNVSGSPLHGFTGTAFLTGIDPSVDAQNAETVDFSFTGSGSLTYS